VTRPQRPARPRHNQCSMPKTEHHRTDVTSGEREDTRKRGAEGIQAFQIHFPLRTDISLPERTRIDRKKHVAGCDPSGPRGLERDDLAEERW